MADSTTTTSLPDWVNDASQDIYNRANTLSQQDYPLYSGPRVAGFSQGQREGIDYLRDNASAGSGSMDGAQSALSALSQNDWQAPTATATLSGAPDWSAITGTAANVGAITGTAEQTRASQLAEFMNPYTNDVVNATLSDMNRSRQMAMNDIGAGAAAAGAFGGSRHGVADAETNRAFLDETGQVAGALRSQGFDTALAAAQQNTGLRQDMALANLGYQNQAAQQNASMQQQMSLANLGYQNQAASENASNLLQAAQANQNALNATSLANQNAAIQARTLNNNTSLQAASALGALGTAQQEHAINAGRAMYEAGSPEQSLGQANLDTAYRDYMDQRQYPYEQLNYALGALGGTPYQTTTTQNVNQDANISGQVIGGIGTAAALGSLFGLWG